MTPSEAKELIECFDPWKTIFFFYGKYHLVGRDDLLREVTNAEAEKLLESYVWDLWTIGNPPEALPESCPAFLYAKIPINCGVEEFLAMAFYLKFKQSTIDNVSKN